MSELRIEDRKRSMKLFPKVVIGILFLLLLTAISAFFMNDDIIVKEHEQSADHQIIMNIAKGQSSVYENNYGVANSVVYFDKLTGDTITFIGNAMFHIALRSNAAPDFEYIQQERIRKRLEEEKLIEQERKKRVAQEQKRAKELERKRKKAEKEKALRIKRALEKEAIEATKKEQMKDVRKASKSTSKRKPAKKVTKKAPKKVNKKLLDIENALDGLDDLE
jgi:hypothetical protein